MPALKPFALSDEHVAVVRRPRRIVVNHQMDGLLKAVNAGMSIPEIIEYEFGFADEPGSHIDAEWWSLDNVFPMKSHRLISEKSTSVPGYITPEKVKVFQQWAEEGTNIASVYIDETHKRGLECFYSYRLNETLEKNNEGEDTPAAWHMSGEFDQPLLNFEVPEVVDKKVSYFRELAEKFDFDGFELDFARGTIMMSPGTQWAQRRIINDFVWRVREAAQAAAKKRGRPILLCARVCDNLAGCHFDGLDIRSWIQSNLVDMLALGVRSLELDVAGFRNLIGDRPIQVLATLDDHHCSDGYSWPPIEVWRGLAADWWAQGIHAIQTFNWGVADPSVGKHFGLEFNGAYREGGRQIPVYQQAYHELGDPETLRFLSKQFVVQRRGGGGSGGADVHQWATPRHTYQNTNALAQLPIYVSQDPNVDILLRIRIADDLVANIEQIRDLTVRLLFSDPEASYLPDEERVNSASINPFWDIEQLVTEPPGINLIDHLRVRLNNIPLAEAEVEDGWFVFRPESTVFAVGENLIGVSIDDGYVRFIDAASDSPKSTRISLEKVEVHVCYGR